MRNPTYARKDASGMFYYEAIKILVCISGNYSFKSISGADMYGYLYRDQFNPLYPSGNYLVQDDDSGSSYEFLFKYWLNSTISYVVVVTTFSTEVTTGFSINGQGPGVVTFAPDRNYIN